MEPVRVVDPRTDKLGSALHQPLSFMILGTSRSGTTLVQRIACEISGVRTPPETHFFCSLGPDRIRAQRFPLSRENLGGFLSEYRTAFSKHTGHHLAIDASSLVEFGVDCERPVDLFAAVVRGLSGPAQVLGEKTTHHIIWWRPLCRAIPDLKLVFVVRDPRAVVASILNAPWRQRSHLLLAERWKQEQAETISAASALGDRCLVLLYEDVVRDPESIQAELKAFLNAGTEPPAAAADVPGARRGMVMPWETWKEGVWEPVTTGRVNAWQGTLTRSQSLDIASICRSAMREFGYPQPNGSGWADRRRFRLTPPEVARRWLFRKAGRRRLRAIDALEL